MFLSVSLSVRVCLPVTVSFSLWIVIFLVVCLYICLSVSSFLHLSPFRSHSLSIYPSVQLCFFLSPFLFVSVCVSLFLFLFLQDSYQNSMTFPQLPREVLAFFHDNRCIFTLLISHYKMYNISKLMLSNIRDLSWLVCTLLKHDTISMTSSLVWPWAYEKMRPVTCTSVAMKNLNSGISTITGLWTDMSHISFRQIRS